MTRATLPAPRIPAALRNFIYPEKNLLPVNVLSANLALDIETPWPDPATTGQTDHLMLIYTRPDGVAHKLPAIALPGPIHFPFRVWLPHEYLQAQGTAHVAFEVTTHADEKHESAPVDFTIDLRQPNNGQAGTKPIVADEVSSGPGVTHEYLREHCNTVQFRIEHYPGQTKGDQIGLKLGGSNEPVLAYALVTQTDRDTVIGLNAEYFLGMPDGVHLAYYTLFSRAGNAGENSKGTFIRIALGPRTTS